MFGNMDPDLISKVELEAICREDIPLTGIRELWYLIPGMVLDKGLRRIENDRTALEMANCVGNGEWVSLYVVRDDECSPTDLDNSGTSCIPSDQPIPLSVVVPDQPFNVSAVEADDMESEGEDDKLYDQNVDSDVDEIDNGGSEEAAEAGQADVEENVGVAENIRVAETPLVEETAVVDEESLGVDAARHEEILVAEEHVCEMQTDVVGDEELQNQAECNFGGEELRTEVECNDGGEEILGVESSSDDSEFSFKESEGAESSSDDFLFEENVDLELESEENELDIDDLVNVDAIEDVNETAEGSKQRRGQSNSGRCDLFTDEVREEVRDVEREVEEEVRDVEGEFVEDELFSLSGSDDG